MPPHLLRSLLAQCKERLSIDNKVEKIRDFIRLESFRLVSLSKSFPYFAREIYDDNAYHISAVGIRFSLLLTFTGRLQRRSNRTLGCSLEALLWHEI